MQREREERRETGRNKTRASFYLVLCSHSDELSRSPSSLASAPSLSSSSFSSSPSSSSSSPLCFPFLFVFLFLCTFFLFSLFLRTFFCSLLSDLSRVFRQRFSSSNDPLFGSHFLRQLILISFFTFLFSSRSTSRGLPFVLSTLTAISGLSQFCFRASRSLFSSQHRIERREEARNITETSEARGRKRERRSTRERHQALDV